MTEYILCATYVLLYSSDALLFRRIWSLQPVNVCNLSRNSSNYEAQAIYFEPENDACIYHHGISRVAIGKSMATLPRH